MTTYTVFSPITSNTAAVVDMVDGDTLLVGDDGAVANTSTGLAVRSFGSVSMDVLGDVYAASASAIAAFTDSLDLWIGANANILSNASAIHLDNTAAFSTIENHGHVSGTIDLWSEGTLLANYGTVTDMTGVAVHMAASAGMNVAVENAGVIRGATGVLGGSSNDSVLNAGQIYGVIILGSGDDTFDNMTGWTERTVFLEGGDDRYVADATASNGLHRANGGEGSDTIDFSDALAAVWVHLSYNGYQAFTSGTAIATNANATTPLGRLTAFENVIGTGGSDVVHGNAADNSYTYTGHAASAVDQFFGYEGSDTFDASYLGETGSAVWVDLTVVGTDVWMSGQDTATNANANIQVAALDNVENVVGTQFSDRVSGSGADNTYFYNGSFADMTPPALGPADFFDGRGGSDTIDFSLSPYSVWVSLAAAGVEAWTSGGALSNDVNATLRIADLVSVENVVGSPASDTIRGNSADNRLDGFGIQSGISTEDVLIGFGGDDTFAYRDGYFLARIGDFVAGGVLDSIELGGFGPAFDTFAEVMAAATQVGANVAIDFGDGDVLTLANVTLGNLTASDFVFV